MYNELVQYNDQEEKIVFVGTIVEDPDRRISSIRIVVKPDELAQAKILITMPEDLDFQYGNSLKISGFLRTPVIFDDFNYQEFLIKDGIYSVMYNPEIELLRIREGSVISRAYTFILSVKQGFRDVLYTHIPAPQNTILAAILLGDKGGLSDDVKESLNAAGVRHITAISGMHITILTAILMSFFIGIGLWRQQAFYVAIILMVLFIVMTGLQPSAIRAGIMGGLLLLGQHLGRMNVSVRALAYAAAIMLFLNPFLLSRDVGFQLSFLAVLGIIYFSPIFLSLLRKIPNNFHLREIMSMTLGAQVLTFPILIVNFGLISLISIAANILIVPLLPFLIALGFLFFFGGMMWEPLGFILSLPVSLLLTYLLAVTEFFASLPFAYLKIENPSIFLLALFYIPIWILFRKFRKRQEFPSLYL